LIMFGLQVMQLLWNLFEHAADTANQAAAPPSCAGCNGQQQAPAADALLQQQQDLCVGGLQHTEQQQQQQPVFARADCPECPAQQLVDVLSLALAQQMASCSSLQVRVGLQCQALSRDCRRTLHAPKCAACMVHSGDACYTAYPGPPVSDLVTYTHAPAHLLRRGSSSATTP
jgi:hypothetical protein